MLFKKRFIVNTKMVEKFLLTACMAVLGFSCVHAQNGSGYFNQAVNLFKSKNYYEAAQVFEKYLATEKNSRPRSTPFAIEKTPGHRIMLTPCGSPIHISETNA